MRNIYTGWPGCTHDARVLRTSELYINAEEGRLFEQNHFIIGDSAYPVRTWLIPPFKDNGHLTIIQRRFNKAVSSSRQVVERAFGHLKGRFRRLREITVHKPESIVRLIVSACILHNVAILAHDEIQQYIEEVDQDQCHPNNFPIIFRNVPDGVAFRQQLMDNMP